MLSGVLDEAPTGAVIRREDAAAWTEIGAHEDLLLSPGDEQRFHLIESRIPPGAGAGEDLYTFPADVELVYVLAGRLELRVRKLYRIGAGDTLTYAPRIRTVAQPLRRRGGRRALVLGAEPALLTAGGRPL